MQNKTKQNPMKVKKNTGKEQEVEQVYREVNKHIGSKEISLQMTRI